MNGGIDTGESIVDVVNGDDHIIENVGKSGGEIINDLITDISGFPNAGFLSMPEVPSVPSTARPFQ